MYNVQQHRNLRGAQSFHHISYLSENSQDNKQMPSNFDLQRGPYNYRTKLLTIDPSLANSSMNWRLTQQESTKPRRAVSSTRFSNRYHQHAKDGFVYWPIDKMSKKPKSYDSKLYQHRNYISLLIL